MLMRSGLYKIVRMNQSTQTELSEFGEVSTQTMVCVGETSTQTRHDVVCVKEQSTQTIIVKEKAQSHAASGQTDTIKSINNAFNETQTDYSKNQFIYCGNNEKGGNVQFVETVKPTEIKNDNSVNIEKEFVKFHPEVGINFEAWLIYFQNNCNRLGLSDDFQFQNFPKFLAGTALQTYINFGLTCSNLNQVFDLFKEKFFQPNTSFGAFNNLKYDGSPHKLGTYFQKKVESGRMLGLNANLILEGLTSGLPDHLKQLMLVRDPVSPTEWLTCATKLVEEIQQSSARPNFYRGNNSNFSPNNSQFRNVTDYRNRYQSGATRPQGPVQIYPVRQNTPKTWDSRYRGPPPNFQPWGGAPVNRNTTPKTHLSDKFPQTPCRYCEAQGITQAFHWEASCINKPSTSRQIPPREVNEHTECQRY